MKRLFKYASVFAMAGILSLTLISTANAQRGFHGGGGVRVGVGFGGGFRGGIGLGFRTGVYGGYYGYPSFGYRISVLPYGYYPFYWDSDLYYYYGGVFYRPYDGGGYEVTVPPVGAEVPGLPRGASSIVINGQQFYEFNGVYYQAVLNDKGKTVYVIAGKNGVLNTDGSDGSVDNPPAPQVGDVVNQLPDNCRKVKLNGKKYYVSPDGIYYEEFTDANNMRAYRIASIPMDDEKQN
ncbi:MAG: hypothetical protein JST50_21415 [Bacteroidetes bacterium]|jgi:hypothetical protein|nr:hypothetical protein [Bacteroidota bacterium]